MGAVAALLAGVALVALSVAEGRASVALFVIVPVVTGSSLPFLLGVVLIAVGFLSMPFALVAESNESDLALPERDAAEQAGPPARGGVGGVVLVGPVPIVFGSWKGVSRRTLVWLAVAGTVLVIVALVAFVWLVR